jgi:uncharacterized lipoprotein YmbA
MSGQMPWDKALLDAQVKQAALLDDCQDEVVRLKVTITNLRRRLQQAKLVHANWLLRQQTWRAEREELLRRLRKAGTNELT